MNRKSEILSKFMNKVILNTFKELKKKKNDKRRKIFKNLTRFEKF